MLGSVLDVDGEFAGEVTAVRTQGRPGSALAHMLAAIRTGAIAGAIPAAAVFAIYFLANREMALPWIRIATLIAIYGPGVGVLLSTSVSALVLAFDRIARLGFGLRLFANPITAGGLGGVIAGIAPGAIGVIVFGAYHGPFVGTALIACSLIAGSVMISIPLARRARRARIATEDRAVAFAAVIATVILCAVAVVIAPVIVNSAFAKAQGEIEEYGALVGGVAGAIGGGVVGIYIGLVIAIGRSLPARAQ